MKSTIQKSLYTLFLASYIFSASCFANENETPKENNETTSSSSQKKKDKSNPKVDKSKKKRPQTINKKIFLFSLPLAAIAATYMFSKRSDTPNNNGGGQTPQGSNPSSNNENNPSNKSGGGQNPQKNNRSNSSIDYNDVHVQEELLETLLKSKDGIDEKDKEGKTLLYKYLEKGHEEAVKYLIKLGADVNLALRLACRFCKKDIVNALLESYEADATITVVDKKTLFHVICCQSNLTQEQRKEAVGIIQLLKAKGGKINAKTSLVSDSALYMACKHYYYDLAEELINQGADVNVKSGYLESNLLIATCQYGYQLSNNIEDFKKTIDLLLSKGIEINATSKGKKTALHMACKCNTKDMVEYLIKKGAKDKADNKGDLPAHFASINREYGHAILTLLKEKSFNIKAKNNRDKTPEDIATNGKMTEDFLSVFK